MNKIITLLFTSAFVAACTNSMGYVPAKMTDQDKALVQTGLRILLKDPSAAQVEELRLFTNPKGARMVCGRVNGKNSFGAYSGFQVFLVTSAPGLSVNRPITAIGAVAAIDCSGAGYPVY
ncbi:hypothetical protein N9Y41_02190 [Planktomarina temperata]|nr:hypothetical protein [Planktomarina temperata]